MLLEINNVDKGYGHGRFHKKDIVLENVSLTLDKGKTVGIMGGSGKGKTTLGLLMAGVIRPDKGKIFLNGQDIWAGSRKERDKKNYGSNSPLDLYFTNNNKQLNIKNLSISHQII